MAAEIRRGHRVTGGGGNFGIPESLCLLGSSLADRGARTSREKCSSQLLDQYAVIGDGILHSIVA